jgi:SAM-dependent methyltransferase
LNLGRYYDWLTRYERVGGWLGRTSGQPTLTLHRLLHTSRSDVLPADVVHHWIVGAVKSSPPLRTIDAGCGAGGTVLYLHAQLGGEYDGLTLSRAQWDRARAEARARGVSAACRFHVRSYDEKLTDLVPTGADLIVAIESLAHAENPPRTLQHLARSLAPGGRFVIVDDVPDDDLARDDSDFSGFRAGWGCPAILSHRQLLDALANAGLAIERQEDFTAGVRLRDRDAVERLVRLNRRMRGVTPWKPAAAVLDGLWGGLLLERLYHRRQMNYRAVVARRHI